MFLTNLFIAAFLTFVYREYIPTIVLAITRKYKPVFTLTINRLLWFLPTTPTTNM